MRAECGASIEGQGKRRARVPDLKAGASRMDIAGAKGRDERFFRPAALEVQQVTEYPDRPIKNQITSYKKYN
jgi:hypothetical protein